MPKVTRKETAAAAAAPLREVPAAPSGMEVEAGEEQLPPKPSFGVLSAQEQAGSKVEFRRVSRPRRRSRSRGVGHAVLRGGGGQRAARQPPHTATAEPAVCGRGSERRRATPPPARPPLSPSPHTTPPRPPARPAPRAPDPRAAAPHDAAQGGVDAAVHTDHGPPQARHAHEPQDQKSGDQDHGGDAERGRAAEGRRLCARVPAGLRGGRGSSGLEGRG